MAQELQPPVNNPTARHFVRQEWQECPYVWGVDDMILVQTSKGQMALINVFVDLATGAVEYEPVTHETMPRGWLQQQSKANLAAMAARLEAIAERKRKSDDGR